MSKIIGSTTTTPVPRSDWAQTDANKVDFIKNKPDNIVYTVGDEVDADLVKDTVSWNDLTDKPFGDTTTGGDTLTWDGNTDGLIAITLVEEEDYSEICYKISDAIVTISDLENGVTFEYSTEWSEHIERDMLEEYVPGIVFINDAAFVAENGVGVDVDGTVYPERGVYITCTGGSLGYVSSVTIPGYTGFITTEIKTIDKKYLPKHLQFGDTITTGVGDTLTWDGNIEGLVRCSLYEYGSYYKVSDSIVTISDLNKEITYIDNYGDEYSSTLEVFAPGVLTNYDIYFVEEKAAGKEVEGIVFPESGIYFWHEEGWHITSLTIPDDTFTIIKNKTIDMKYLPKHLHFGEVTTSGDTLTWNGDPEGLVSILIYQDGLFYEKYCKVSENDITISDLGYSVTIQNSEGNTYKYYDYELAEEVPGIVFVDEVVFVSENGVGVEAREIVFPESGVYFIKRPDRHITSITISGYTDFITTTIKKIDKKYLPNSSGLIIKYNGENGEYTANMTFEEARESIISGMAPTYVRYLEDYQVKTHGFNYAETGVNYNYIEFCFNNGTSHLYLRFDSNGSIYIPEPM